MDLTVSLFCEHLNTSHDDLMHPVSLHSEQKNVFLQTLGHRVTVVANHILLLFFTLVLANVLTKVFSIYKQHVNT